MNLMRRSCGCLRVGSIRQTARTIHTLVSERAGHAGKISTSLETAMCRFFFTAASCVVVLGCGVSHRDARTNPALPESIAHQREQTVSPRSSPDAPQQEEPSGRTPVPPDEPDSNAHREEVLSIVRECPELTSAKGLGVHGSALQLNLAVIVSPGEARARGERGVFPLLSADFRSIHIPESPPFDQAAPNGLSLVINLQNRTCKAPLWRR
jgi:hypothetical protein